MPGEQGDDQKQHRRNGQAQQGAARQQHKYIGVIGIDRLTAGINKPGPAGDGHQDQRGDKRLESKPADQRPIGNPHRQRHQQGKRDKQHKRRIGDPEAGRDRARKRHN